MHPAKQLWNELAEHADYPPGVLRVREAIRGTAFFPGGYGLVSTNSADDLPPFPFQGVMIVGHDFHSEQGYEKSLALGGEPESQPTWRNLLWILRKADLPPDRCFFTNFFMGLRRGSITTGPFPGAVSDTFVGYCRKFLLRQVSVQMPRLILTLGIQTPYFMSELSPELSDWRGGKGLKHLDARGALQRGVTFPSLPSYTTTVVALTHPCCWHASVRYRQFQDARGADAELKMLREAIKSAGVRSV